MARPTKAKALERLRRALDAIPALKNRHDSSPEFKKWRRDTQVTITHTFGNESRHIGDFREIEFSPRLDFAGLPGVSAPSFEAAYLEGLESAAAVLESMIEEIKEYWEDESQTPTPSEIHETAQINTNEVFIIHGRDKETKQTVARFLEKIGLKPVILHERPDGGRTIIEKFEQHAEVGFAVALLTPDDLGSLRGEEDDRKPRARQNVIFEFGYFIGKLSRKRVCALVKGKVEKPSDYDGVLYIPLDDSGGWKMELIRELQHAGFHVDANKAV